MDPTGFSDEYTDPGSNITNTIPYKPVVVDPHAYDTPGNKQSETTANDSAQITTQADTGGGNDQSTPGNNDGISGNDVEDKGGKNDTTPKFHPGEDRNPNESGPGNNPTTTPRTTRFSGNPVMNRVYPQQERIGVYGQHEEFENFNNIPQIRWFTSSGSDVLDFLTNYYFSMMNNINMVSNNMAYALTTVDQSPKTLGVSDSSMLEIYAIGKAGGINLSGALNGGRAIVGGAPLLAGKATGTATATQLYKLVQLLMARGMSEKGAIEYIEAMSARFTRNMPALERIEALRSKMLLSKDVIENIIVDFSCTGVNLDE